MMKPAPAELSSSYPVYKCDVSTLLDLKTLEWPSRNFILFLAADFRLAKPEEIESTASDLIRKGNAYICAWGDGCDDVDTFWQAAASKLSEDGWADHFTVAMTHEDETFEEAAWFALNCAWVDASIKDQTSIVLLSVGSEESKSALDFICSDADGFNERADEEEGFAKLVDPDNPENTDEHEYRKSNFGESLSDEN